MIELHTWSTPNGRKISIALEEMELPYTMHPVNIRESEQFTPQFLHRLATIYRIKSLEKLVLLLFG